MNYNSPEHHRDESIRKFSEWAKAKYDAGQKEHGGRFWRKPAMRCMRDEIIDQAFYWINENEHREEALRILDDVYSFVLTGAENTDIALDIICRSRILEAIERTQNILRYGNPEGEREEEFNAPKD